MKSEGMEEDMFKKLLLGICAVSMAFFVGSASFAQVSGETSLMVYSGELVSPLKFDVKTGDTLNLKIQNKSNEDIIFEVPLMDISVAIEKNTKSVVPISFTNPADKNIWFIVKQLGGNNKNGTFNVVDYTVKVPTSNVNRINTSSLRDIINYDTTFVYDEKPEPIYRTNIMPSVSYTPSSSYEPVEKPIYTEPDPEPIEKPVSAPVSGGYVRGYW